MPAGVGASRGGCLYADRCSCRPRRSCGRASGLTKARASEHGEHRQTGRQTDSQPARQPAHSLFHSIPFIPYRRQTGQQREDARVMRVIRQQPAASSKQQAASTSRAGQGPLSDNQTARCISSDLTMTHFPKRSQTFRSQNSALVSHQSVPNSALLWTLSAPLP
jgi:hypothetical protein